MMNTLNFFSKSKRILCTIITYTLWLIIIPWAIIFILLPLSLLPEKIRFRVPFFYNLGSILGKLTLATSLVKFEVSRDEPSFPQQGVYIMNHTSAFDIPVMEALVGSTPHLWMSKASYKYIPGAGIILMRMHVLVERFLPRQAQAALKKMLSLMNKHKLSAFMFPEGTRHQDGLVHQFKPGCVVLARELGIPIIPIISIGLEQIFPKGSFVIDSSSTVVKIKIGKAINASAFESQDACLAFLMSYYSNEVKKLKNH